MSPIIMGFYLKSKLEKAENGSLTILQQSPKPLTNGALYMIYVILTFLGLSVIGTLITFYNYLCNGRKETNSPNSVQNKNYDIRKGSNKEDAKKSSDTTSDS
ncbi:hypothetical protein NPIL_194621, partial [Nephila pilipes]